MQGEQVRLVLRAIAAVCLSVADSLEGGEPRAVRAPRNTTLKVRSKRA